MSDYTAGKRRSKRNRTLAFDTSRISIQSPKPNNKKKKVVSNMEQSNGIRDTTIRDLSGSINNTQPSTSKSARVPSNLPPTPTPSNQQGDVNNVIRSMVCESMNDARGYLRSWVEESVAKEMDKIHSVINRLSDNVSRLSINVQNQPTIPTTLPNPPGNPTDEFPTQHRDNVNNGNRRSTVYRHSWNKSGTFWNTFLRETKQSVGGRFYLPAGILSTTLEISLGRHFK